MPTTSPAPCLITGGHGFIGGHLLRRLSQIGHPVTVLDRTPPPPWLHDTARARFLRGDLLDLVQQPDILRGIDTVFHLAWAHTPESATAHPVGDIQSNLISTIRLLQACAEQGVRRLIFLSTGGAIYGPVNTLPVPETHPASPISAYGVTKLATEKYIELYHHLHGLEYIILRPSVPYGPFQNPDGRQGAVAVFMGKILRGQPITFWGDGDAIVRDFFHVEDLTRACVLAMQYPASTGLFNIGGGTGVSLHELITLMREVVGLKQDVRVQQCPPRSFDVPRLVLDTTAARTQLGWHPTIPLAEGLQLTWQWYRDIWYPVVCSR
ncbi:MAG: NAD-dependent epimerase/dehydratase family protein [Chloroflexi bacterium]|nr:NAD-dependent epimerase/dehydratase family protein [Chloroflexota bacterium]